MFNVDQIAKDHSNQIRCDTTVWLSIQQIRKFVFRISLFDSTEGKKETKPSEKFVFRISLFDSTEGKKETKPSEKFVFRISLFDSTEGKKETKPSVLKTRHRDRAVFK